MHKHPRLDELWHDAERIGDKARHSHFLRELGKGLGDTLISGLETADPDLKPVVDYVRGLDKMTHQERRDYLGMEEGSVLAKLKTFAVKMFGDEVETMAKRP